MDHHECASIVDSAKGHDAGVLGSIGAPPSDALLRSLFGDPRVPLAVDAPDISDPVLMSVVDLADRFDSLHESGEFLELRPLVVCHPDGDVDLDRLLEIHRALPPGAEREPDDRVDARGAAHP